MRTLLLLSLLVVALAGASPFADLSGFGYEPLADPKAVVTEGNARFTVLTPYVIRMEYSSNAQFEDRATIVAVNRKLPVPQFTSKKDSMHLTIVTSAITLKYSFGQVFSKLTLSAVFSNGGSWKFGDVDYGNLLGTIKSLDGLCTVSLNCTQNADIFIHDEKLHCAWGAVSRSGWTTIDDTDNFIMGNATIDDSWFAANSRSVDDTDIYLFAHGNNFRQALQDFILISGHPPLTNRALLGSWWTRWYDYDHAAVLRIIDLFKTLTIPLDVLVLDMNWHTKNDWTGYSWDRQLFPHPNDTLEVFHAKNLFISANLHDANGVGTWEDTYEAMCTLMGQDPKSHMAVLFQPLNMTYMHGLEDVTLGVANFDFYWIDWQQGGTNGGCTGGRLNPTLITDHVRGTDHMRRKDNLRDQILARWGGLGSHRYPVGFSGDVTQLSWECFAYEPYFSVTAANVAYGSISHDFVGPHDDHELHVRWMQFGSFSGVLRIHDRGMSAGSCEEKQTCAVVDLWLLPFEYFEPIRDAMLKRNSLLPYMYTATRAAFDTGVSMVYPMYYDYPDAQGAYLMGPDGVYAQYMFGPDIMVAPICTKADTSTELTMKQIWLPPGEWFDDVFGFLERGEGSLVRQEYALQEIPMFVRAGAIIPKLPNPGETGIAQVQWSAIDIYIYPGVTSNNYSMYEDDGVTLNYLKGDYSFTNIKYVKPSLSTMTITIDANAAAPVKTRAWRVFLVNSMPVKTATSNGVNLPYARTSDGMTPSWSYSGQDCTAILTLGVSQMSTKVAVEITFAADENQAALARARIYASRMQLAKRLLDNTRETPYSTSTGPGKFKSAAAYGADLEYMAAHNISGFITSIGPLYTSALTDAVKEIGGSPIPTPPPSQQKALVQLWSDNRQDMCLCGTPKCLYINGDYQVMWIEGYQPDELSPDAIQLHDYYSTQYSDNYATVASDVQTNYEPAVFAGGCASKDNGPDRTCLELWVSPSNNDHFTLSSSNSEAVDWVQTHTYSQIEPCMAYILKNLTATTRAQKEFNHIFDAIRNREKPMLARELADLWLSEQQKEHAKNGADTRAKQLAQALLESALPNSS